MHRNTLLENFMVAAKHAAIDREEARHPRLAATCPICHSAMALAELTAHVSICRFGGGRLNRYVCSTCRALIGPFKMLDMTPAELSTEYALLYASYSEGDTTEDSARTFHSMNPRRDAVYLDWGCGWWSKSIHSLRAQGWNVWGYEPTPGGNDEFILEDIGHIAPGLAGIFSNNMIEHLIDPVGEFKTMRTLLAPGGVMAHSTPCYDARYLDTRFHVLFFLEDSIRTLADRTGFEVICREADGEYMNTVFRAV